MGCAQSNQISDISSPLSLPLESPVGLLRITVTTCNITSYDSMMSTIDPYIIVQLSNQMFRSNILKGVSKTGQIKWNQSHEFIINKARTIFGRVLEVQVWDQYRLGQSQIGFGTLDLDPLVKANIQSMANSQTPTPNNKPVSQHEYKCWLNCKNNPTGYINFTCSFQELPHEILHFRFESAIIRKKTRLIGNMNCRVKVTLGQQQLSTSCCPDTKQRPPTWLGQIDILKIKYPVVKTLLDCRIGLFDQNQLIGQISVNIHEVQALDKGIEKEFMEDMFLNQQQTASMRYSIVRGDNPKFNKKDLVGTKVIKRKDQQKKQQPKKEDTIKKDQPANKEEPKKDEPPKKEEPKKQEPKKQELKKQEPKKEEPKKEELKKQEHKKQEPKKEEPKKEEPKKDELIKQEPKKEEPKKDEPPKKEELKKQELKKQEHKKQEPKKEEPNKEEPKKEEPKKEEPKKEDVKQEPKKQEAKKQEQNKQELIRQQQQNRSEPIKQVNTANNNKRQSNNKIEQNENVNVTKKQEQNKLNDEQKQRLKQNESELNINKTLINNGINEQNKISEQNKKQNQNQHKESNPIV